MDSKIEVDWTICDGSTTISTYSNNFFLAMTYKNSDKIGVFGWKNEYEKQLFVEPYWGEIEQMRAKFFADRNEVIEYAKSHPNVLQYGEARIMQIQYHVDSQCITADDLR